MEKQLSGKLFQDFQHWPFFRRSRKTWRRRTSNQRTSRTGTSSCQCSMTWCGKQMMRIVSLTLKRSRITAKKILPVHWTFLCPGSKERWYGDSHDQKRQWDSQRQQNDKAIQRNWSSCVQRHQRFRSLSLEAKKKGKNTIHFNGDSVNTDRPVSNSLFCHFGAVTDWSYQLGLKDEEKERVNIPLKNWDAFMNVSHSFTAPGNKNMSFWVLEKKIQMTQLCEKALFPHLVTDWKFFEKIDRDEDGNSYFSAPRIFQVSILSKNKSLESYSCRNIYWTSVLGCLLWNKGEKKAVTALFSLKLPSGELDTLVVVGVRGRPRTVQISNLAGKRGAGQESPLRVVPGVPMCMGGDPEHVQMIPCSSATCPGIVVSLAGIFISFPFVVLPGIN